MNQRYPHTGYYIEETIGNPKIVFFVGGTDHICGRLEVSLRQEKIRCETQLGDFAIAQRQDGVDLPQERAVIEKVYGTYALEVESMTTGKQ